MTDEILSEWPVAQNTLFILFGVCFFISVLFVGNWRKLLISMLHHLFRKQEQQSVFSQTVNNEFLIKVVLCSQTILMASIFVYCVCSRVLALPFETTRQLLGTLGGTALIVLVFVLYKLLANYGVGFVFFPHDSVRVWNTLFFSIVSLSGIVLFVPALLIFYFPNTFYVSVSLFLFYFLFVGALMVYKIVKIFFQQKSSLLYFILYLCTQELLPVFFAYKALAHFYRM